MIRNPWRQIVSFTTYTIFFFLKKEKNEKKEKNKKQMMSVNVILKMSVKIAPGA
jgi:hypothetical protein